MIEGEYGGHEFDGFSLHCVNCGKMWGECTSPLIPRRFRRGRMNDDADRLPGMIRTAQRMETDQIIDELNAQVNAVREDPKADTVKLRFCWKRRDLGTGPAFSRVRWEMFAGVFRCVVIEIQNEGVCEYTWQVWNPSLPAQSTASRHGQLVASSGSTTITSPGKAMRFAEAVLKVELEG